MKRTIEWGGWRESSNALQGCDWLKYSMDNSGTHFYDGRSAKHGYIMGHRISVHANIEGIN